MHSLATVCVRALGAYLIVVTNMSGFAMMLTTQLSFRNTGTIALPLAPPVAFALLGVAMITWSKSLSGLLTSGLEAPPTSSMDAPQLLQVGTALLALFFLAGAVSDIAASAWDYFKQASPSESEAVTAMCKARMMTNFVGAATNLVTGFALLLLARALWSGVSRQA
jgi:hypothetical protein